MKDFDVTSVITPARQEWDTEGMWAGITERMNTVPKRRFKHVPVWSGIAACVMITIAYIWGGSRTAPTTAPASTTYSTIPGQRASIPLADGSVITIAPATKLVVTGRNVELQGEAVFTVNQHTGNPFTVKSGNTITRVLGTTFGIRAYDDHIRIAVSQGKISISNTSQRPEGAQRFSPGQRPGSNGGQILIPGDIAEISNAHTTIYHNRDVSELLGWTAGDLTIRNTPIIEAFTQLSRWYGVEFRVADSSLMARRVSGVFPSQFSKVDIHSLGRVIDAQARQSGNTITFSKQ